MIIDNRYKELYKYSKKVCFRFFLRLSPVWIMFFMAQYPYAYFSAVPNMGGLQRAEISAR